MAAAWGVAGASPAGASASTASFGVSATVVAACTIAPTPWTRGPVCLRPASGQAIAHPAAPVVTFSRDPTTGALVKTIAF